MGEIIFGIFLFWAVIFIMESTAEYKTGEQALGVLEKCESKLPRDKKCTLTARPVTRPVTNTNTNKHNRSK